MHILDRLLFWSSRLFFLMGRSGFRTLLALKMWKEARNAEEPTWQGYGEILCQKPFFFHYAMFQAPRWNCHAAIGILRRLKVTQSLRIQVADANLKAKAWTIVIYGQGAKAKTTTHIDPDSHTDQNGWVQLDLPPGHYNLGMRYYEQQENAQWPQVNVDGKHTIHATPLGSEPVLYGAYLKRIQGKSPLFYRLVHLHLAVALRLAKNNPTNLDNLVLPVGNPCTRFHYGILKTGEQLQIQAQPHTQEQCLIYLTLLNFASLPISWCQILDPTYLSPPMSQNALYLLRLHALPGNRVEDHHLRLRIKSQN